MEGINLSNNSRPTILVVDDIVENIELLYETLTIQGYDVRCAKNGKLALMTVERELPDLILMDVKMPEMDGFHVCEILKQNPNTADIPVIFVSGVDDVEDKVTAFNLGATDYITKPFEIKEIIARVGTQIRLLNAQSQLKKLNLELENRVKERTIELERLNLELKQENERRKEIQAKLVHDALYDYLTNLPNRNFFLNRLEEIMQDSSTLRQFAILFIDLDRFKLINDSLGHQVGDRLLIFCGELLKKCVRKNDLVARLGGDEFAVLLDNIQNITYVTQVAERIQTRLKQSHPLEKQNFAPSASIGIVIGDSENKNPSEMLRNADTAMYRAKEMGRSKYAIFNQELHQRVVERLELESDLERAINRDELKIYYQPIVELENHNLIGFECLLRWQHPEKGFISPLKFIPIAEDSGMITTIGEWVLRESCHQLKQWIREYPQAENFSLNVNVSPRQLENGNFPQLIAFVLEMNELNPHNLKVEITESVFLLNEEITMENLSSISDLGVRICLDDFGTGYSSLSYLHRFPVNIVKVDSSFVRRMEGKDRNYQIISAIVNLGHSLDMTLVAEGIETEAQKELLFSLGCELGQGYWFGKPVSAIETESLIKSKLI